MRGLAVCAVVLAACKADPPERAPAPAALSSARPYALQTPRDEHPGEPLPLLVALHGYGGTGAGQDRYWGLGALATSKRVLVATPDGTPDKRGARFWNATDACCNFDGRSDVDDVAYVMSIVDDVSAHHAVDPKRVYLVGHSNGAFLAYRVACERAPRIAAIVSLAGATWNDPSRCAPASPVNVLQIQGTSDDVIKPSGGHVFERRTMAPYPPLAQTMATWAKLDGCSDRATPVGPPFDLDARVAGPETTASRYEGCRPGGTVELWTMAGSLHSPQLEKPVFAEAVYAWLMAHPKP